MAKISEVQRLKNFAAIVGTPGVFLYSGEHYFITGRIVLYGVPDNEKLRNEIRMQIYTITETFNWCPLPVYDGRSNIGIYDIDL